MNLVGLPLLCVEARAQTQGIDREREHNCRALLSRDRIERLKQASSETQENQFESVMFLFCFFVLQKIKLQTNKNGIEIFLWLVMLFVCFSFKTSCLKTNKRLVILFVCGGEGNRNWDHAMLKLSGWISTSRIGFQPIALVGSPGLDSDRMNFAKKIPAWSGHIFDKFWVTSLLLQSSRHTVSIYLVTKPSGDNLWTQIAKRTVEDSDLDLIC